MVANILLIIIAIIAGLWLVAFIFAGLFVPKSPEEQALEDAEQLAWIRENCHKK